MGGCGVNTSGVRVGATARPLPAQLCVVATQGHYVVATQGHCVVATQGHCVIATQVHCVIGTQGHCVIATQGRCDCHTRTLTASETCLCSTPEHHVLGKNNLKIKNVTKGVAVAPFGVCGFFHPTALPAKNSQKKCFVLPPPLGPLLGAALKGRLHWLRHFGDPP